MAAEKKNGKSSGALFIWIFAVFAMAAGAAFDATGGLAFVVVSVLAGLLPIAIVIWVLKSIRKASAAQTHSHDRIDHTQDLKINPKTGKTERPVQHQTHSPQEHWKQQLDGLLANGTIDRTEYREMMKRKF